MGDRHFQQAYEKHMAGNRQSARMLYERIIKKNPGHVDARYMLGTLLAESGVLELGLVHLKSAASRKPDSPMIHTNLGHVYLKLGKIEQAINSYQKSLKLNPHSPEILFNLGVIFYKQEKLGEAAGYLENCLEQNPDFTTAYPLLGKIHRELQHPDLAVACFMKLLEYTPDSIEVLFELGNIFAAHQDYANATIYFKRILDIDPGNDSARHAVAALSGETTAAAPLQHVEQIFDELSENFENHLEQLGYHAPEIFKSMIAALAGNNVHFDHAIDLGCGTGLSGMQFRPMVTHLTGLDLSQKMVDLARAKGIYDELSKDDLCHFLELSQQQFDLFIATDVFPYIGDLSSVFKMVGLHARPDSYFLFSTEMALEQDYILRPTGRYAHSHKYIEAMANTHGFAIAASQSTDLRREGQQPIKGELYVLKPGCAG